LLSDVSILEPNGRLPQILIVEHERALTIELLLSGHARRTDRQGGQGVGRDHAVVTHIAGDFDVSLVPGFLLRPLA
jgi:hypothetical protein